jgi:hypothetical protein
VFRINGEVMRKYTIIEPDPTLENNLMMLGFQCGDGWTSLIYEMLDKLQAIADSDGLDDLKVTEVKEKWGGLRVYLNDYPKSVSAILDEYNERSTHICELCGEPGDLRYISGVYKTLCIKCYRKVMPDNIDKKRKSHIPNCTTS